MPLGAPYRSGFLGVSESLVENISRYLSCVPRFGFSGIVYGHKIFTWASTDLSGVFLDFDLPRGPSVYMWRSKANGKKQVSHITLGLIDTSC